MEKTGKVIIIVGGFIIFIGIIVFFFGDKLRFLGRLPGDIRIEKENMRVYIPITTMILVSRIEKENMRVYIPITTMILVSMVVSLILYLIQRFGK